MAPSKTPKTAASAPKKEKIFHPSSRKADQLARKALRKGKLGNLASKRSQKQNSLGMSFANRGRRLLTKGGIVDFYGFFFQALPEEGVLTLSELHSAIRDVWLSRFDEELEQEQAARRKGRPKSAKEVRLQEIKLREAEEYRTGMGECEASPNAALLDVQAEVIDLTHRATVELFRRWDQKEAAYIQLLRFVRITSTDPDIVVVSRPGKHISISGGSGTEDHEMGDIEG
ncbi:hypothetical protein C0989_001908 [Termitomyces sp. Mn162]|nr:hypothetical protein C0989_001908 [Termitomyces sp. Mn162]